MVILVPNEETGKIDTVNLSGQVIEVASQEIAKREVDRMEEYAFYGLISGLAIVAIYYLIRKANKC